MCTSPLHIKPKNVYESHYNYVRANVPCCKCASCREQYRIEWLNRLCFEYDANKGGCAVFLTFTYNNEHLPSYTDGNFHVKCFNHQHVLKFLKTLRRYYIKRVGFVPFKYFFASEYGKTTQRPHYHALFFLDATISQDWQTFCEVCREIWSTSIFCNFLGSSVTDIQSNNYGFMFPNLVGARLVNGKVIGGQYLDEKGQDRCPKINDGYGGMSYCSKYVCKDLSYYTPEINHYIENCSSDVLEKFKKYLPKHWQSNKLGYSAVDVARANIHSALDSGIVNPLSLKKIPLPSYVINKLMYINVYRDRLNTDGKRLYDKEISEFGKLYFEKLFRTRVHKTAEKMFIRFQMLPSCFPLLSSIGANFKDVKSFYGLALYHLYLKNISNVLLEDMLYFVGGSPADLFNVDNVAPYYYRSKSQAYKRTHPDFDTEKRAFGEFWRNNYSFIFSDYENLDNAYSDLCIEIERDTMAKRLEKFNQIIDTKEKLTHGFPINLC